MIVGEYVGLIVGVRVVMYDWVDVSVSVSIGVTG